MTTNQRLLQSLQLPLVQYLLLYLAVTVFFIPTFWYTYVWDDWTTIGQNTSIRDFSNLPRFFTDPNTFSHDPGDKNINAWRSLRNVYYLLTYKVHGLHPAGWHFHHVLLQSLMASVLLAFFHRLYRFAMVWPEEAFLPINIQVGTWFAVLIWAIHPVNTEVTAWLKSADDILACLFGIGALVVLFPPNHCLTYRRVFLACFMYAMALLAKESIPPVILILPALVFILSPQGPKALFSKPLILALILLFLETVVYLYFRTALLGKLEQTAYLAKNFSLMMATMTIAVVRYLQLTFWPFWPTVQIGDYMGMPVASSWANPEVVFSVCIIGVALCIVFLLARRSKMVTAGAAFAVLAFLPVANIVPMMQIMAERFLYFPIMGVSLAVAAVFAYLLRQPGRFWIAVPIVLSIAMGFTTFQRLPVWKDNFRFHAANVAAQGTNARARYNYALRINASGYTTSALAMLNVLYRDHPQQMVAGLMAVVLYNKLGHETTGSLALDELIKSFPENERPMALKADLARMDKDYETAVKYYERALALKPELPRLWYFTGESYYELGNITSATAALHRAQSLDNSDTSVTELLQRIKLTDPQSGNQITQDTANGITH